MNDGCLSIILRTAAFAVGLGIAVGLPPLLRLSPEWSGLTGFVTGYVTLYVIGSWLA